MNNSTSDNKTRHQSSARTVDSHVSEEIFFKKLLEYEDKVRLITDERELAYHFCNSIREVLSIGQAFLGPVVKKGQRFTLKNISSISTVDRDSPFTLWFESAVNTLISETGGHEQITFRANEFSSEVNSNNDTFLCPYLLWTPQIQEGVLIGGFISSRDTPWHQSECNLISRLAFLYMHALAACRGGRGLVREPVVTKPVVGSVLLLLGLMLFLPVPITALAPVEVAPQNPFILTAPFAGAVRQILPEQGQHLSVGEQAIIFDDMHLLNEKQLAEQKVAVAQANYQRTTQGAIADYRVKRDIEVARAQYELAQAESAYASELYDKSMLTTPVSGVAIFSGKNDWEGKPVSAGEAILSIADPEQVEFSIDLPIKESLLLEKGAKVRVFLDSDPLHPLDAVLAEANYNATADKRDVLSYKLKAKLLDTEQPPPRIGVQGTAQVFGEKATLGYVLLRRPYSVFRQWTGW